MSDALLTPTQTAPAIRAEPVSTRRLLSLDALRGFDMFWIVGGDYLVHALRHACPIAPLNLLDGQMEHKDWQGFGFYDLIFPLFVFIAGVSAVFSLSRSIEREGKAATIRRILIRSAVLFLLGVIQYGGVSKGFELIRLMGVLQRIAICYCVAGILFTLVRTRGLVAICVSLLIAYWALVSFAPVRNFNLETQHLKARNLEPRSEETKKLFYATTDFVRGRFEDGLNLTQHFDFQFLPGRKWDGAYDPEGILSTLPAIATCLLGVFAGLLLKNVGVPDQKKVLYMLGVGVAGVALGFLWGLQFPVIKKIWTSSFVLVAGGYSSIFLGAFYQMIEIWQWRKWCTPFVWIGMNAITIYLATHLIQFPTYASLLVGGPIQQSLGLWGDFLLRLVVVVLVLTLVRFLFGRKLFLRL